MKKIVNEIKLIATDLDGTLLNREKKISDFTASVLKRLSEVGIDICISTGRFLRDIKLEMEGIDLYPYYINMNGAEVNSPEGKLLKDINIDILDLELVIKILDYYNLIPEFYTSDDEYMIGISKDDSAKELLNRFKCSMPHKEISLDDIYINSRYKHRHYCKDIKELYNLGIKTRKIITFSKDYKKINEAKKELKKIKGIACLSSLDCNIEVTNIKAQKGYALLELIDELQIDKENVIVFGDGENDLSMFELFPNSVAMENAMDLIKRKARYTTKSNDDDGVAKFILEEII